MCFRAKTNVVLAKARRSDYVPFFKGAMSSKSNSFTNVLANVPFFKAFPPWTIEKLAGSIRMQNFGRKQFVYREGDDVDNVYVVKEGDFEQTKAFSVISDANGSPQLKGITPGTISECLSLNAEGIAKALLIVNQDKKKKPEPEKKVEEKTTSKPLSDKAQEKVIKLKALGEGELFGEDEIVVKNRIRQ